METDDLTTLRASVTHLSEDEKLALAAFLSLECTSQVTFPEFQDTQSYREVLKDAFQSSAKFDRATKLGFAIELLGFCRDAEEDNNGVNEPCYGYPGHWDWDEDCS